MGAACLPVGCALYYGQVVVEHLGWKVKFPAPEFVGEARMGVRGGFLVKCGVHPGLEFASDVLPTLLIVGRLFPRH